MLQRIRAPNSTTRYQYIALKGGLDLLTPLLELKPGRLRDSLNFEQSITGGYSRIGGYERVDGHPSPSLAIWLSVTLSISGTVNIGNTITGLTSGATGIVISKTSDGAGHFIVAYTKSTGTFVVAENVQVGGITQATVFALGGVSTAADYSTMQQALAADVYRADIAAVPGAGPIRGVASLNGVRYAWRNNVGNTAMAIYKTSGAGWTLVPLLFELAFTAGTNDYVPGDTVSQGGVSSTVRQTCLESGTFAGGTAAGRLIINAPTGGNFAAGAIAGGGAATASGVQTAIALLPGGRVETDKGNFGQGAKLYGADGVNRGFEFDGTVLAPIKTGNTPDVPKHVLVHTDHLWFSFTDNLQNSGITTPFNWSATAGGASYRCNGLITALFRQPGDQTTGAMSVTTTTGTEMIYGKSAADFRKTSFEESAGAKDYGVQRIGGQSIAFGDTGVFSLSAAQAFGNFEPISMTLNIRPFTQVRTNKCVASTINRTKSQYRVFFSDGAALFMTIVNNKVVGSMPVSFPDVVTCTCQGDALDGAESSFFGSTNGFVYQLDAGTSFDGAAIDFYWTLTFAFQGSPEELARFREVSFEVQGDSYATFAMTYQVGYGEGDRPQGDFPVSSVIALGAGFWDDPSLTWDAGVWDGKSLAPNKLKIDAVGENIALRIEGSSAAYEPFTFNSAILHYSKRKALKSQ